MPSHALKPTFELPKFPDTIAAETPARVGASIFPERDNGHDFSILNPFNAMLNAEIFTARMQKEEAEQKKKQMTFQLFGEWISLRPKDVFVGYVSAIVMKIDLASLYKKVELFCAPCACGNVVFGNVSAGRCFSRSHEETTMALRVNPQVLAEMSDETAGFTSGHNLLVDQKAWEKLFGRSAELFDKLTAPEGTSSEAERLLRHWEQRLLHLRLTFVMGWSGSWGGGRIVVLDLLD